MTTPAQAATPPTPGTPEHDAAMAAKVDAAAAAATAQAGGAPLGGAPAAQPTPAARPEHIPEKFWDAAKGEVNVEAMAKSYTELERAKAPTTPAQPAQGAPVVADGKPDMAALSAEFVANGVLSEASYTALATVGLDKAMVDTYIAGQQALAASRDEQGFTLAGGKEQFATMSAWAAKSLPPAEVAALNAGLAGDAGQMALAVKALKASYEAAVGKDPTLTSGSSGAADTGTAPFASRAEVTAAMRDPRYKADPAYRATVEARVGAMTVF